jgi:PE family
MTLRVVPEGLAAASSAVETLTARLAAAHAAAAPLVTAVVPPAVDAVSLQTAAGLSAHGFPHNAMAAQGVEELGRSGVGVGESGVSYATGDAMAAVSYLAAHAPLGS